MDPTTNETTTTPAAETTESKKSPLVETLTAQAARGLAATKRALEVSAKWLEARAKDLGDLEQKLAA